MTYVGDRCRTPACRTVPTVGYVPRGLCPFHETEGLDSIGMLCRDYGDLQPLIWDKARSGLGEVGGGKFGPSEPINLAADALAREIAYTAVLWETPVRERARLAEIADGGQPTYDDLARATRTLAAHYSALLALPAVDHLDYDRKVAAADGPDAVIALTALHRRARSMVGITTRTSSVPGMCSVCSHEMLRHRDGADDVYCANCRATWTWDEHQDAVSIIPVRRAA